MKMKLKRGDHVMFMRLNATTIGEADVLWDLHYQTVPTTGEVRFSTCGAFSSRPIRGSVPDDVGSGHLEYVAIRHAMWGVDIEQ